SLDFGTVCNGGNGTSNITVKNSCPTKNITNINYTIKNLSNGSNAISASNITGYVNFSGQIAPNETYTENFTLNIGDAQYPGVYNGTFDIKIIFNDSTEVEINNLGTKVVVQDCTAPNISCHNASGNYNVTNSINISANATDNINVTNVTFSVVNPFGNAYTNLYGVQANNIWTYYNFNDTSYCGTYNYTSCATDNGTTPNNSTDSCVTCNFTIDSFCGDGICSNISVNCGENYTNCLGDCCSQTTTTDISITQSANTTHASYNETINWTVTINNTGDTIVNVTFNNSESNCSFSNITNLQPGNSSNVSCTTTMYCNNITNNVTANATSICNSTKINASETVTANNTCNKPDSCDSCHSSITRRTDIVFF
ncbi:MAG: hypothetical protein CO072_01415, partial [Candidatus Huberarchaeum crystalense]